MSGTRAHMSLCFCYEEMGGGEREGTCTCAHAVMGKRWARRVQARRPLTALFSGGRVCTRRRRAGGISMSRRPATSLITPHTHARARVCVCVRADQSIDKRPLQRTRALWRLIATHARFWPLSVLSFACACHPLHTFTLQLARREGSQLPPRTHVGKESAHTHRRTVGFVELLCVCVHARTATATRCSRMCRPAQGSSTFWHAQKDFSSTAKQRNRITLLCNPRSSLLFYFIFTFTNCTHFNAFVHFLQTR